MKIGSLGPGLRSDEDIQPDTPIIPFASDRTSETLGKSGRTEMATPSPSGASTPLGTQREDLERSVSLLGSAHNDYIFADLCLYTSQNSCDHVLNLASARGLENGSLPATYYSSTDVLTAGYLGGASESNVSSLVAQNGGIVGNDPYGGGAPAAQADAPSSPPFDIQVLNDVSSDGSGHGNPMLQIGQSAPGTSGAFSTVFGSTQDFTNGILVANGANVPGAASDALSALQRLCLAIRRTDREH